MYKKQKYSSLQKKYYHESRLKKNIKETKKLYSKNWLDGFNDDHVSDNLIAVKDEIARAKKNKISSKSNYYICLIGYKNGLLARLKK